MGKGSRNRQQREQRARITPTWDGGAVITTGAGHTAEMFASGESHPVTRGQHHWVVMASFCIDVDRYDPAQRHGGGLGVLGPDRLFVLTPVVCSECAAEYTPEERNTRCSGEC